MKRTMLAILVLLIAVPLMSQDLTDWQKQEQFNGVNKTAKLSVNQPDVLYDAFFNYNLGLIVSNQMSQRLPWYKADVIAFAAEFAFSYKDVFSYKMNNDGILPIGGGIKLSNWQAAGLGILTNRLSTLLYNGLVHHNWSLNSSAFQSR